jgi:hypothetical protein
MNVFHVRRMAEGISDVFGSRIIDAQKGARGARFW